MIGNLVIEIEPAEPPISQVQLNLLAQPPLEADAVAVANDQHPDQELRIDRRSTDVAIERCQLLAQVSQHLHYNRIDPAQEMARRNAPFEVEQIEQLALIARLPTHHGKPPPLMSQATESLFAENHEHFFNSIGHNRKSLHRSNIIPFPPLNQPNDTT